MHCRNCGIGLSKENTYKGRRGVCRECAKEYFRKWYQNNREKKKEANKAFWKKLREEVFSVYGKQCSCCGESRVEFLTIDHVNNNGSKHRQELKDSHGRVHKQAGGNFYLWLRKNGYPKDGYRTLCWNCNVSRGLFGYCPHENERSDQPA